MNADDILAGVLDLTVSSPLALDALISVSAVEWSRDINTACVECAHRPRLLLNPEFVREWCGTSERLAMLLLHELSHISLGHTRLYARVTPEHNVAFDAIINARLLHGLLRKSIDPAPYAALFESYYRPDESPFFLLRPPPGWPAAPEWKASKGCPAALRAIHKKLYSPKRADQETTYTEIVQALRNSGGSGNGADIGDRLLGAHGETLEEMRALGERGKDATEAFAPTLDRLDEFDGEKNGWGPRESASGFVIEQHRAQRALQHALSKLLKSVLATQDAGDKRRRISQTPIVSVDPSRDRRAGARRLLARHYGTPEPLLFASHIETSRPDPVAATIYIDVSGSMSNVLGPLHGALVPLKQLIAAEVLAFSCDVVPIAHAAFVRGSVSTTWGTDIEPVLVHAAAQSAGRGAVRRALVLTDGYFSAPSHESIARLVASKQQLHIAVAGSGPLPVGPWVASATRLPNINFGRN